MDASRITAAAALGAACLLAAPAPAFQDESDAIEGDPTGFVCELPEQTEAWPGLAEQLGAECDRQRHDFEEREAEARETAPDAPWADHLTWHQHWGVAGRTARLLSLVSEIYRYDGGAHGNTAFDAKMWDLAGDREVAFPALFTDRYAAYSVIDKDYCRLLSDMQRDREVDTGDDWWGGCPPLHEQTIVPAGEPGAPFTSIGVYVPPYVAGPYVAGSFEVSVEVTPELIALLRPEFRDSFAAPEERRGVSGGE